MPPHGRSRDDDLHYGCSLWTGRACLEASREFSKLSLLATGMRAPRRNTGVPRARVSRF